MQPPVAVTHLLSSTDHWVKLQQTFKFPVVRSLPPSDFPNLPSLPVPVASLAEGEFDLPPIELVLQPFDDRRVHLADAAF